MTITSSAYKCDICGDMRYPSYCQNCIIKKQVLSKGEIIVKTSKIDAVIDFINDIENNPIERYTRESLRSMLEELKKKG